MASKTSLASSEGAAGSRMRRSVFVRLHSAEPKPCRQKPGAQQKHERRDPEQDLRRLRLLFRHAECEHADAERCEDDDEAPYDQPLRPWRTTLHELTQGLAIRHQAILDGLADGP